ncbi:hypothetical protein [Streptomyces rimosus]|uniref:hypothetical protein n=1 Tax=Streptomyces rimosus TaxID=1927 RepID=UPI0004C1388B|nr:hypothetical protein [Streptomyces rimosus]
MNVEAMLDGRCWRGCEPAASNPAVFVGPGDFFGLHLPLFLCLRHRQRLRERAGFGSSACSLCEAIGVVVDRIGEDTSVVTSVRRWPDGRRVVTKWAVNVVLYGCLPCQAAVQEAATYSFRDRARLVGASRRPLKPAL